jgi:hypothetical protein
MYEQNISDKVIKFGFLGIVKDEDWHYKKSFYLDEDKVKSEIISRKFLCEKCDYYKIGMRGDKDKLFLCDKYEDICKRAYKLGYNKGYYGCKYDLIKFLGIQIGG